jgi:sec-independent protein translocase protein TatA
MSFSPLHIALIEGLGGSEMVLVFVVVLMLFGGKKLPEFARGLGKSIREFKKAAAGVEDELKRALEEDALQNAAAAPKIAPVIPTAPAPLAIEPASPAPPASDIADSATPPAPPPETPDKPT